MSIQDCQQVIVTVEGKGDSKQHAFASALGNIQKKMMQESEVILRIEPVEVEVIKATEKRTKNDSSSSSFHEKEPAIMWSWK